MGRFFVSHDLAAVAGASPQPDAAQILVRHERPATRQRLVIANASRCAPTLCRGCASPSSSCSARWARSPRPSRRVTMLVAKQNRGSAPGAFADPALILRAVRRSLCHTGRTTSLHPPLLSPVSLASIHAARTQGRAPQYDEEVATAPRVVAAVGGPGGGRVATAPGSRAATLVVSRPPCGLVVSS